MSPWILVLVLVAGPGDSVGFFPHATHEACLEMQRGFNAPLPPGSTVRALASCVRSTDLPLPR